MSKKNRLWALEFVRFFSYALGIESMSVGVGAVIYLSLTSDKYGLAVGILLQVNLFILIISLTMTLVLFYIGNYCHRKADEIEFAEWKAKNEQV